MRVKTTIPHSGHPWDRCESLSSAYRPVYLGFRVLNSFLDISAYNISSKVITKIRTVCLVMSGHVVDVHENRTENMQFGNATALEVRAGGFGGGGTTRTHLGEPQRNIWSHIWQWYSVRKLLPGSMTLLSSLKCAGVHLSRKAFACPVRVLVRKNRFNNACSTGTQPLQDMTTGKYP